MVNKCMKFDEISFITIEVMSKVKGFQAAIVDVDNIRMMTLLDLLV